MARGSGAGRAICAARLPPKPRLRAGGDPLPRARDRGQHRAVRGRQRRAPADAAGGRPVESRRGPHRGSRGRARQLPDLVLVGDAADLARDRAPPRAVLRAVRLGTGRVQPVERRRSTQRPGTHRERRVLRHARRRTGCRPSAVDRRRSAGLCPARRAGTRDVAAGLQRRPVRGRPDHHAERPTGGDCRRRRGRVPRARGRARLRRGRAALLRAGLQHRRERAGQRRHHVVAQRVRPAETGLDSGTCRGAAGRGLAGAVSRVAAGRVPAGQRRHLPEVHARGAARRCRPVPVARGVWRCPCGSC